MSITPACHLKGAIRKVNNNYWIYNSMFSHKIAHLHHLHLEHPVVSLPLLVGPECSVVSFQSGHIDNYSTPTLYQFSCGEKKILEHF